MFSEDDKVGYGNPPKEHQFKPGQSGNPAGRPANRRKNLQQLFNEEFGEVLITGPFENCTFEEVLMKQLKQKASQGDLKAIQIYLKYAEKYSPELRVTADFNDEDLKREMLRAQTAINKFGGSAVALNCYAARNNLKISDILDNLDQHTLTPEELKYI